MNGKNCATLIMCILFVFVKHIYEVINVRVSFLLHFYVLLSWHWLTVVAVRMIMSDYEKDWINFTEEQILTLIIKSQTNFNALSTHELINQILTYRSWIIQPKKSDMSDIDLLFVSLSAHISPYPSSSYITRTLLNGPEANSLHIVFVLFLELIFAGMSIVFTFITHSNTQATHFTFYRAFNVDFSHYNVFRRLALGEW